MRRHRHRPDHDDGAIADLPAVTVRAVQHISPPPRPQAGDVGKDVTHSGRNDESARPDGRSVVESQDESVVHSGGGHGGRFDESSAVGFEFGSPDCEEIARRHAVAAQKVVHPRRRRVARQAGIAHQHRTARSRQRRRGAEPGRPATDHRHVTGQGSRMLSGHGLRMHQRRTQMASPLAETARARHSGRHDRHLRRRSRRGRPAVAGTAQPARYDAWRN